MSCGRFITFLKYNFYNKVFFWICVLIISVWSMSIIFLLMMTRFRTDSTSIGVTTTYIHWSNTFPAVSICLIKNKLTEEFTEIVKKRAPPNKTLENTYIRNLYEYLFLVPENSNIKEAYCRGWNSTCGVDILELRKLLLAHSCQTFIKELYYGNKFIYNCEKYFKFHKLEVGYCFLANNLIDHKTHDRLPLKYSPSDKYRNLRLTLRSELLYRYQLYVHSPEDVPYFNAEVFSVTTRPTMYSFNIEELHNNQEVIEEPVQQRMCKFPEETSQSNYVYSFSTCMSQIRQAMEMKLCNCTIFNSKSNEDYCDVQGIKCVQDGNILISLKSSCNIMDLYIICTHLAGISQKVKHFVSVNLVCLPSCMEQQISWVGSIEKDVEQKDFQVEVDIASLPTARFYRIVTQSKLDIIVAIGGVIGLFMGLSLLNILEVISFIIKKIFKFLIK